MIKSFRSTAVEAFFTAGNSRRLPVQNTARLRRLLLALDAAATPEDMNLPGFRFHPLHAAPPRWSVWVSGNYRLTWAWDGGATHVDVEDYH
ncbi:MAG: type II toxin-antitoxin system RelE/ParE family toxin [Zavarzinia sp.]|nr:type II toxin-antitoxin system RelE/ParE family toxin [Zavarzinia sp.]